MTLDVCENRRDEDGNYKAKFECCSTVQDVNGRVTEKCTFYCMDENKNGYIICKDQKFEGTLNPDITGDAEAGVLQDKNTDSKDTNIGSDAGILQGESATNSSNNTGVMNPAIL